jgi:transcriptional regulator with XRE-family HTH domain
MKKTNFDRYLAEQLKDPDFAARFKRAGEAWDVALQIAALREQAGLSQAQLAARLRTSQQQISRLESPGYEGHSLSMLRRVAKVLNVRVRVVLEPADAAKALSVAEVPAPYFAESTCPPKLQRRRKLIRAEAGRVKRRAAKSVGAS